MTAFASLAAVIRSTILGDTGSGGVFETGGANKIVGCWTGDAPDDTDYPYVVVTSSSEEQVPDFDGDFDRITVDVTLYADRSAGIRDAADIAARLRTLLSRVALTVSGYGAPVGLLESTETPEVDDETRLHVLTIRYDMEAQ